MSMLTVFLLYCIQAHLQRTPSWTLCVLFIQVQVTLRLHPPDVAFHLYLTGTYF